MNFRPNAIAGVGGSGPGFVDYRLARRFTLREFKRGRLSRLDICDAHPELIRVANASPVNSQEICPVCEEHPLFHVTYVFGPGLPAQGKCVHDDADRRKLQRSPRELTAYIVEVCTSCKWNHLARVYAIGGRRGAMAREVNS